MYEDFARAHDPDDATVGALVVGFGAALESRWGFHPLRTLMMLDSVHDVVMQGLERPGKRNGGTPRLARPTAREPFAVVPRSALELRRAHSDFLTTHVYSLAAALFALPHWGEYLAEQGLVAGASARGAWRRFLDEARPELGELLVKSLEERHDRAAAEEVRAFLLHS